MRLILQIFLLTIGCWQCSCKVTPVDLSYGYDENTIYWPGGRPFKWTAKRLGEKQGAKYASYDFETSEHSGTHIDAPYHFNRDGTTVDKIPLYKFFVTGVLINATSETGTNSSYSLPADKLIEWERTNGEIPSNSVIIINFGWGNKFYSDRKQYLGPADDDLKYPSISREAADWIANTKRVVGVGVDTASPDIPKDVYAHILFAKNDMYILENLNLSVALPHKFNLMMLPMKLVDGSGGPTRVVAFI